MNNHKENTGQRLPRGSAGIALAKSGSLCFPLSLGKTSWLLFLQKVPEAEEIPSFLARDTFLDLPLGLFFFFFLIAFI